MNFFKSVFADEEPDSPKSDSKPSDDLSPPDSDPNSPPSQHNLIPNPNPNPNPIDSTTSDPPAAAWSFGGLIKTLSTKSESVIEIYRRDLKEFGSGLKKEIEVAHGSLENVGHTIDEISTTVLKGTAQIISQGKEAILAVDHESDSSDTNNERSLVSPHSLNSKPYSRFDTQVRAIQGDASTYCEEPEDLDDYEKWKAGFEIEEKGEEIESLLEENGALESIHNRVVPNDVDVETFWCRYYYKIYKLKLAEDLRANLVKRAISREEEDLSWDVDDEEEEEDDDLKDVNENQEGERQAGSSLNKNEDSATGRDEIENDKSEKILKSDEQIEGVKEDIFVEEPKSKDSSTSSGDDKVEFGKGKDETESKADEKAGAEGKGENGESSKDSDVSVISSHPSIQEEEDLGWDEIEDMSSIDERKVSHSDSPKMADLRRRLSGAAEEEEDLSWDIEEDDDEAVKA
ncbi:BSD domain-containing protein [Euphorbia peplus]|nr:BSD domain-containing protein [Euphorbia peplus]